MGASLCISPLFIHLLCPHKMCDDLQQLQADAGFRSLILHSPARDTLPCLQTTMGPILLNLSHQHVTAHPKQDHCQTAICGMVELQVKQQQLAGHAQTASEIVCSVSLDSRRKTQCIALWAQVINRVVQRHITLKCWWFFVCRKTFNYTAHFITAYMKS